jgi:hypothetical protein
MRWSDVSALTRRDGNCSKVAIAPKPASPREKSLDPQVKSWIDNVIVPTLVREYLAFHNKCREPLEPDATMVHCSNLNASPKGDR